MDIAEVARRSGVPASTLRYYEERGLISSVGRRGLRRTFDPGVLRQLALIALARGVGFSLDEIRSLVGAAGKLDRSMLEAKAAELDAAISKMMAMRDELRKALACPAPSHLECPTFQRLLEVAATTRHRRKATIGGQKR